VTSSTKPTAETRVSTPVDVVRDTLLHESGLLNPTLEEMGEAHQLAQTVIREVLAHQIVLPDLSAGLQESLRDLADLVADEPETATAEQIHDVAAALRSFIDRHAATQARAR
jgi:hypothetical protein